MADTTKKKGALDRIGSLPDPIISHIFSFLSTKDTVRTSILSSRWRYLFFSMSTLDFDHFSNPQNRKNTIHFKNFVDRFFFQPIKVNLECLKVNDSWLEDRVRVNNSWIKGPSRDDDYLRISGWICAAVWRGVKKIDIDMGLDNALELPAQLFTCRSLTTLNLSLMGVMNVPTNLCLPNLKTLRLTLLFKVRGSIHRLISSCPVLEDLVIAHCYFDDISELNIHNLSLKRLVLDNDRDHDYLIVINAPSLVYFQCINKGGKGYTLRNVDSLEKADISIDEVGRERSAAKLFRGIRHVKSLHLTVSCLEMLPRRLLDKRITFRKLVELKFGSSLDGRKGMWLLNFLHCVPNLKTLTVEYMVVTELGIRALPKEVPSCLSFHLKEITISKFEGDAQMFELVSYFLNNAMVLDKFVLGIGNLSEKDQLSILKKILRLPKNSKKCEVMTC